MGGLFPRYRAQPRHSGLPVAIHTNGAAEAAGRSRTSLRNKASSLRRSSLGDRTNHARVFQGYYYPLALSP